MNKKKLYIIGNGFDIAHGLKTSYEDFHMYLLRNLEEPMRTIVNVISKHEEGCRWSAVEESLGKIEIKDIEDIDKRYSENSSKFTLIETVGIGEDGEEIEQPTSNKELIKVVEEFKERVGMIPKEFQNWIKTIKINVDGKPNIQKLFEADDYLVLNFNYVNELEEIYHVNADDICYIHGTQNTETFYFGHGEKISSKHLFEGYNDEDGNLVLTDVGISKSLFKDTEKLIEENKSFFNKLEGITDIYIYGFSFGKVDMPYIKKISQILPKAKWNIYDYDNREKKKISDTLAKKMQDIELEEMVYWEP